MSTPPQWRAGQRITAADLTAQTIVGETGQRYRLISGTIRNTGDGWKLINDSTHRPTGITGVTVLSDRIQINHAVGAVRVSSMQVTPDETYAERLRCGVSVGLDSSTIFLHTQSPTSITDRVYYDAGTSTWKSELGVYTGLSFSSGVLTLTHQAMGTTGQQGIAIGQRGSLACLAGGYTSTTTQVVFYSGSFGSLTAATTPASTMNAYVTRHGWRSSVPALDPSTVTSATGNLWITGLLELP